MASASSSSDSPENFCCNLGREVLLGLTVVDVVVANLGAFVTRVCGLTFGTLCIGLGLGFVPGGVPRLSIND